MKIKTVLALFAVGILGQVLATAGTYFTLTVGSQTGSINYGTTNVATFPITLSGKTGNNTVTVNLTASGLPSGATYGFSPNNFSATAFTTTSTLFVTNGVSVPKNAYTITVNDTGLGISGKGTLTVGAGSVTISSGLAANDKTYDRTTTATISSNNVVLSGISPGDVNNVHLSTNGYTASFSTAAVGTGKAVTVAGLTLTGGGATNYTLVQPSLTANISSATVTVSSGLTVNTKNYDGGTTTTINSRNVVLSGVVTGDNVGLSTNGYSASFASKNAGTGVSVSVSGLTLTGSAAPNYSLSQPTLTGAINKTNITVTAVANTKTYDGTTSAAATPTVTSGKVQTGDSANFTETYGAKNKGTGLTLTSAGTVTDGNSGNNYNYNFVAANNGTITALAVSLSGTRAYDGTTSATAAILSVANKISGDTVNVASGTGSLAGKNAGTEAITSLGTLALGNNTAGNYTLTGANGSVIITHAGSAIVVASSENPSGFKDGVSFTAASLPAGATGSVIFRTNGIALSTNALASGSATSATTTLLPRGTNAITAEYAGDINYLGSTNSLNQIVTNHPPVAAPVSLSRTAGLSLKFALSNLATNWSDADGDTITLASINLTTTNGVSLTTNSTLIFYNSNSSVNDQFTYTITDGQGGTNTGVVNIVVNPFVARFSSTVTFTSNTANVMSSGIPGYTYITQRSTDLTTWVNVSTNTAAGNGSISATDDFSDLGGNPPPSAYYRLEWQP